MRTMLNISRASQHPIAFLPGASAHSLWWSAVQLLNQRMCAGHPHIVQLLEVFITPQHLAIVMELANGGVSSRS